MRLLGKMRFKFLSMTESLPRYETRCMVLGVHNNIESDFASENECALFTVTSKEAEQSYARIPLLGNLGRVVFWSLLGRREKNVH